MFELFLQFVCLKLFYRILFLFLVKGIYYYTFFSLKVKELDSLLGGSSNRPSRIVWTSSRTSSAGTFSIADIQCEFG